ncbi:D-arabinitol 4-dehydrogenase [Propionivibrio soli]|uniref:D-arabinitol 4-dehydrogenase n=1 Tax=Propionivibrio soli TaxID=2976531 RepID=UPI0021E97750|nr:D-arabinitol 4-dehydrogenase [Propionivibrio soli]
MSSVPATLVMLHLGLGSFHRAHQALYIHQLIESGDARWSLAGGNVRPDNMEMIAALAKQGGAYTLETISPQSEHTYTKVTSIREVIPYEPTLGALIARAADPATRIISFTVTEAGYYLDTQNRLDAGLPDIVADLAALHAGKPGTTIYGAIVAMLRRRMQDGGGPVTLLNCDNLRHNGERFRGGLLQFIERLGDTVLLNWVQANATCPNAMVDRITPRPSPDVAQRVLAATGWADAVPVMGESFIQWVIEDKFCAGRPEWEKVGVEMVESVAPYEEAKIRLLNATHSCIAWAGTLIGYQYIHEGTHDAEIRKFAYDYVTDDVIPVLTPSPIDLAKYRDVVLDRFGNPAIRDTNQRVAMDGYSKIPGFIVPTFRDRLGRGQGIASVAMLPALFLAYLERWHRGQIAYTYQDQAMNPEAAHAVCAAPDPVAAFCADPVLWGDLANNPTVVAAVGAAYERVAGFVRGRQP